MKGFDFEDHDEPAGEGGGMLRWLLTYADLITLLLAFFIVLYAMSSTQTIKLQLVAQALANEFTSHSIVGQSTGPSVLSGLSGTQAELQSLNTLQDRLQKAIDKAGLQNQVSITADQRGVLVSLDARLLFPLGSAALSPQAIRLLTTLGGVLNTVPNDVEVSGFTDNNPINTPEFPSNWQLSAMRSSNVVDVLANVPGMKPSRLFSVGFGQYHPRASNATPQGQSLNRRVDILVLKKSVASTFLGPTG